MKNSKGKLGVDCVFSTEALVYPQSDGTVCAMKSHGGRAKADGLCLRIWRGDDGDRHFGFVAVSHALKMMAKAARQGVTIRSDATRTSYPTGSVLKPASPQR